MIYQVYHLNHLEWYQVDPTGCCCHGDLHLAQVELCAYIAALSTSHLSLPLSPFL